MFHLQVLYTHLKDLLFPYHQVCHQHHYSVRCSYNYLCYLKSLLLAKPQGSAYITAGRKAQESVGHLVYILYVLHSVRDFSSPIFPVSPIVIVVISLLSLSYCYVFTS